MLIFFASLLVQVLLIIHCAEAGRNPLRIWVRALLSCPGSEVAVRHARLLRQQGQPEQARRALASCWIA